MTGETKIRRHPMQDRARAEYVAKVAERVFTRMMATTPRSDEYMIEERINISFVAAEMFVARSRQYQGTE